MEASACLTLVLCGDVMIGRGIDQVLPYPGDPLLHEPGCRSAAEYVESAEAQHGAIPRLAPFEYVWGDVLEELKRVSPDVRVINLETAVTTSDAFEWTKDVHYRVSPANVGCLTALKVDCCTLANNHILDWGIDGLNETLNTLANAGMQITGAGRTLEDAVRPAVFAIPGGGRLLIFACGSASAGVPAHWQAGASRPGVWLIDERRPSAVDQVVAAISRWKQPGDVVVLSIHWGANWGYAVPPEQRQFAHSLIDDAGVDVVHGHSSHHVKGIEIHRTRPILYGGGEFLNDYEGIAGDDRYRWDLALMYLVTLSTADGALVRLRMVPLQIRRFRLTLATSQDVAWVIKVLNREGRPFGTSVEPTAEGPLLLKW